MYFSKRWAVFPCHGKAPATPHGFKDAVLSPEDYKELLRKFPGQNIGIATGAISDIFVLDVDVKNGAKGAESLAELEAKHGKLPRTITAATWSGGKHYFFKYPPGGMGCRTNFMPGLDIRGTGGYVVAPPSIVEGKPYTWLHAPTDTPLAEAPEWLLHLLKEQRVAAPAAAGPEAPIPSGGRNSELTSRAGKMRAAGMDASDIYAALQKINATRCQPPLPEKEVRMIAESVGRYTPAAPDAPLTDLWNAERFAEKYGDRVRWCDQLGGWHVWNGGAWRRVDETAIMALAKEFTKDIYRQASATGDKRLKAHAIKSESAGKLKATCELAKSEPGVAMDSGAVDRNNHLLNCANGTLDLNTGAMRPADRGDLITKQLAVNYDPAATCPAWLQFLSDIFQGDGELIDYVQRVAGYSLSGYTTEQKFFLCVGNGRNGKSTFLKHLMYLLAPDYACATPAQTMLESDGNTLHAIASLKGSRLVVLNEFDEGKTLSSAQVKNLTGGEPVVARHLYHEQFVYTPTYKFWLTTNFKPRIKDTSLGIWRRLVVIPFDYTVPPEKVDARLDDKLAAEYAGIFAWAVAGYAKWRAAGLPDLERLRLVAGEYQQDSDLIGQFLADCHDTEADPDGAETTIIELMQGFARWAQQNGVRYYPGRAAVLDYMAKKGYGRPQRSNSAIARGRMVFTGLALKVEARPSYYGTKEAETW